MKHRRCSQRHPRGTASAILGEMLRKSAGAKKFVAVATWDLGWCGRHDAGVSNAAEGMRRDVILE